MPASRIVESLNSQITGSKRLKSPKNKNERTVTQSLMGTMVVRRDSS